MVLRFTGYPSSDGKVVNLPAWTRSHWEMPNDQIIPQRSSVLDLLRPSIHSIFVAVFSSLLVDASTIANPRHSCPLCSVTLRTRSCTLAHTPRPSSGSTHITLSRLRSASRTCSHLLPSSVCFIR
ncbi:hypothetical protein CGRA01v4_12742 [Colletotrichum graminicola]|nr:hypothetical protein CGRA01v4_12742 [Colletotrichum graminicola]